MRVGIDGSNLRWGGGRTHLVEMLSAADAVRGEVSRVTVWGSRDLLERLPARPWLEPVIEVALEGSLPRRTSWQIARLPRLARDVDLVLAPNGIIGPIDQPTVVMCQNLLLFDHEERRRFGVSRTRARLELLRAAHRSSYGRAGGVIFLSRHSETLVRRDLGTSITRSTVIPHGVSPAFLVPPRPQRRRADITPDRPFRIVYVSAVAAYKNHPELIVAVGRVRRDVPVELILIGPAESAGARRALEQAVIAARAEGAVQWLGDVSHEIVREQISSADACIYPSTCESFGIALLEAMASGLPIAAAGTGSLPELLGDAGIYFDGRSSDSIARAILRLVDSEYLRAELAQQASARAAELTWERCAAATFRFMSDVAATASR